MKETSRDKIGGLNRLQAAPEGKGQSGLSNAAIRWGQAMNSDGRFGRWSYQLVWEVGELNRVLMEMAKRVA